MSTRFPKARIPQAFTVCVQPALDLQTSSVILLQTM